MKEVMGEYGGMILAAVGSFALFWVLKESVLASDGMLSKMIAFWGNGGC